MKNIIYIIMVVMLIGCAYQTVEIATPTTQCGMCDGNIIDALNKLEGREQVQRPYKGKSGNIDGAEEEFSG